MNPAELQCSVCHPTWKKVLAFLVDVWGCFFVFGFITAYFSGDLTEMGFHLEGVPALLVFGLIIGYFVSMRKFFGGTFGKKLFGISKPRR